MKSTLLLALALFLISVPAPDANDIAEITRNFIVPTQLPGLEASEVSPGDVNVSISSGTVEATTFAPGTGEISAPYQSASAAQPVRLSRGKTQNRRVNEG